MLSTLCASPPLRLASALAAARCAPACHVPRERRSQLKGHELCALLVYSDGQQQWCSCWRMSVP